MTLRRICDLAVRAEPLLLVLLIPAIPVPQKLLYLGLLVPPVVWLCAGLARGHFVPRTPLDWAMAPLLAAIGVSHLVAWDSEYSLPKVTFAVWGIVAYYLVARMATSRRGLRLSVGLFLVLGPWMAILSMFATIDITDKFPGLSVIATAIPNIITRWWGFNLNPNPAAGALILFIPVQWLLLWRLCQGPTGIQSRASWLVSLSAQGLGLLLTAGALLLTQTRSAWLGLAVAGIALAAWRFPMQYRRLAAVVVIAVCAAVAAGPHLFAALDRDLPTGLSSLDVESTLWRQQIWSDVIPAIRDHPLTGLGIVRLWDTLARLYPVESLSPVTLSKKEAHSLILEVAVSLGLPGLIALLSVWLGAACAALRARASAPGRWDRALVEGLAAGLLAHFLFGLSESIIFNAKVGIALWFVLGLLVAACGATRPAVQPAPQPAAAARPVPEFRRSP